MKPLIRVWRRGGFTLKLYDLNRRDSYGKWVLGYKLLDGTALIFKGEDYHCSPCHAVDSLEAVCGLLTFLSLCPGDTDSEYFDSYTPEQIKWRDSGRAEELSSIVAETKEWLNRR